MPVSNIWARGSSWSKAGALRWISQRSSIPSIVVGVERLAQHVEHVAEHGVADRDRDATAEVAHRRAADEPVGLLHADAADPPVADLLGHLGRHGVRGAVELNVELDLVVDLGQGVRGELDVDHRSGDGDDAARPRARPAVASPLVRWWSCGQAPFDWRSASAPPTISMISVVMAS